MEMMALAYGHDVALPCLMPHLHFESVFPFHVMMVTGIFHADSIVHSTYPCFGHPHLCRAVHKSSVMILSKNFSS